MFSGAVNTINGVSPSGSISSGGSSNTNKGGIFGIGGSTRSCYQTPEYKAYRAREDAAWAAMSWTEKIGSFFN
jgi:hypothetical protein